MKFKYLKMAFAGLSLSVCGFANAGLILDFTESSGDTIITVSGTFDLTGLNLNSTGIWSNVSNGGGVGKYSQVTVGSSGTNMFYDSHGGTANFDLYTNSFSAGYTTSSTGHAFGIWNFFGQSNGNVEIDQSYISGTALFGQGTLTGWTFSELGLVNSGLWLTMKNGETVNVTLNGVDVSNVPEPSTLAIFALGMIGLASRRFKKQS
jgi:hypothetical protein